MGLDLSGKTVHDLKPEDFENLYCHHCRHYPNDCYRRPRDMDACIMLIDGGMWDLLYRQKPRHIPGRE